MTSRPRSRSDPYPRPGTALALLTIPYIFTQDKLHTSSTFIKSAQERGYSLSVDDLQSFHNYRLLVPLFRVSDSSVLGRRINIEQWDGANARGLTFDAARKGRLRDSAEEGYSAAWPYKRPRDEEDRRWWNGFIYSSWQLLHVGAAIHGQSLIKNGLWPLYRNHKRLSRDHLLIRVLASLATLYLPGILGQISLPSSVDERGLLQYRSESEVPDILTTAGFESAALMTEADKLLSLAHHEPLIKWLPLMRYAHSSAWLKLRGESLDAMWRRIAAEILLRAHEDLAADGVIDPLPNLAEAKLWTPQHDRLTPRYGEAPTLERALAEFGLSPHPKVILLVEGKTELYQVSKLLAEFGITQPQEVRVQCAKSSKINAHLIARYGATPRVGRWSGDGWMLDASPTALVIAMDAENFFQTQAQRDEIRRKLQDAIREEVQYQDADIGQDELDFLVSIHVWGDDKYELANFTDDELVSAITTLAIRQGNRRVHVDNWEHNLRDELEAARASHDDIKVPLGRLHVREDKVELAKLLWPALRAKSEKEYASDSIETPVLKLVLEIRNLVYELTGISVLKGR